mmetsp:Transcript_28343/g.61584  ORF Transcript_28343/g.61584 Transcript_28343/m.61584 type:complete len:687 (+) Transcript_28343:81-2141(+)|eukprot:CAMPEP_0206442430 /NCGR_PEP_ID=MMETSP0324_2-20121206/13818_1 /ASSEMBLY_ACC=CAM_ASM_000836 /TAXON_ID=2866 /ORGANISM="Crypthecodinium cohnii, Strain Seligo" /LENGTH=686 /DNA_ID=CAMNT_0053910273 /DNA_START=32 /DNA_END=2092 /DNA_ORIENTATION=+
MKTTFVVAALQALSLSPSSVWADSPVAKAISLLSDLESKIIKEGEAAQKIYAEFSEFCEDHSRQIAHDIKTGQAEVAELNAVIGEADGTSGSLTAKIEQLTSDISVDEADLKAATEIRSKEQESFHTSEKELVEVVDTLQRAIGILEREMKKGGASMLQLKGAKNLVSALETMVQASMLSTSDAKRLTALVQSSEDDQDDGFVQPTAAPYESHSGDIVQTLSDLLDKAEEQLDSVRKQETQDLQAFELMQQSLKDEIKFAEKELAEAKSSLAATGEKKAKAEGDLAMTTKALDVDEKGLAGLKQECMTKAEDYEAETKSRAEELKALAGAKEVLTDSTGAAADVSYSFVQVSAERSGATITSSASLVQFEVMRFVQDLARKQHSSALAQLASRMSSIMHASAASGADPFAKVKGLIMDLVARLEKEAEQDATKKAYCDKELAETNEKKADKTSEIEKLSTSIDKMAATSAQLKEEIASLQKALSDLTSAQAQMDKIRAEEKEAFAKNKADLSEGLQGVKLALKILGEYYAKEDKAHEAAEGAGTSIIGLLEVVESDFTKNLAEMTATEESAQSSYEAESKENSIEKATKEQDVKYKTKESTELDQTVAETTSDRAGVQAELDAILEYLKKIEEQCIAKAESYESRKARYEAELGGLKEALQILESETALVQRSSRKQLRGVRPHSA